MMNDNDLDDNKSKLSRFIRNFPYLKKLVLEFTQTHVSNEGVIRLGHAIS